MSAPALGDRGVATRAVAESVIAGVANQAVIVISGVLVARALGVTDRGSLAWLALIPVSIGQLGTLGLPLAVTYFVTREPADAAAIAHSVVRPAGVQALALTVLHAIILMLILPDQPPHVAAAALITLPVVPITLAQQYALAFVQGTQRFRHLSLLRVLAPTLYSAAVIALVVAGAGHLIAITAAWVVSSAVATAAAVTVGFRGLPDPPSASFANAREMRMFGRAHVLGSSSLIERFRLDQIAVGLLLPPASLGLYVVGAAFTSIFGFIAQSIGAVGYPRMAAVRGTRAQARAVVGYALAAVGICGAVLVGLEISAGWLLPTFFGSAYADAVPLMRMLVMAAALLAVRRVMVDVLRGSGKAFGGNLSEVVAWVSLVPMLAVLVPAWDALGAASAMVVAAAASLAALVAWCLLRSWAEPPSGRPNASGADEAFDAVGAP
jgi:O-antigen/teichoic acid export membrane protein